QYPSRTDSGKTNGKANTKKAKLPEPSSSLIAFSSKKPLKKAKVRSDSFTVSRAQTRSAGTKSVRVLALKETKRRTLVKALVMVPASRSTTRFTAKAKSSSSMRLKALARTKSRVQIASSRRIYHTAVQLSPSLSSNAKTEYQPSPSLSGLRDTTHLESS